MGFNDIPQVERGDFYLDVAFSKAKDRANQVRTRKGPKSRVARIKEIERIRLIVVKDVLVKKLMHVIRTFPNIDDLSLFYVEMVRTTMDYDRLKKSLGALQWCIERVQDLWIKTNLAVTKSDDLTKMHDYRRAFYGRVSSLFKRIDKHLKYLDECRKIMRKFPSVKTSLPSVSISGFPNVGKTTLLFKLTGSKPEIAAYAFTTTGINVGLLKKDKAKLQMLDTPGTLNRFNKMNPIEKQAYLAVKHLAKVIVYVFDVTEPYPLKDQIKLYKQLKEMKKPVLVYISKTDILEEEQYKELAKKYKAITDIKELKEKLLKFL